MDDDDLRRGLPTVHVQWSEATAILAGDALQTLAFGLLTDARIGTLETRSRCCKALPRRWARAAWSGAGAGYRRRNRAEPLDIVAIKRLQQAKTGR